MTNYRYPRRTVAEAYVWGNKGEENGEIYLRGHE